MQGGIGTFGEVERLREEFGIQQTGWGSPFLLVPEATCLDGETRELLRQAAESDLYLSDVSPLGIPFNNLRGTGSELSTQRAISEGRPGSACPKGYLVSDSEFSDRPLCPASRSYQKQKLEQIVAINLPAGERERRIDELTEKTCICDHLGNPALIALGLTRAEKTPQCVCPGPNVAWFDRIYTLRESLVSEQRPHMFAKEMSMLRSIHENVMRGAEACERLTQKPAFEQENLESINVALVELKPRIERLEKRMSALAARGGEAQAVAV